MPTKEREKSLRQKQYKQSAEAAKQERGNYSTTRDSLTRTKKKKRPIFKRRSDPFQEDYTSTTYTEVAL